jgi:hypothetical protein
MAAWMTFGFAPDKPTNLRIDSGPIEETDLSGAIWVSWSDINIEEELDHVCFYLDDGPCVKVFAPATHYMTPTSLPVGIYVVKLQACDVLGECFDMTVPLTAEIPVGHYDK